MADAMSQVDRDCMVAAILATTVLSSGNNDPEYTVNRFAAVLTELRKKDGALGMWERAESSAALEKKFK